METQVVDVPVASKQVPPENPNLNETDDVFEAATQAINENDETAKPQPKRLTVITGESNDVANTPPWSMAALLDDKRIERLEKEKAEREANKKKEKLKKHRFLFSTSSEEDDDDDDTDLEIDLPKPTERFAVMPAKENLKRYPLDNDDKEIPLKKSKTNAHDNEASIAAKILKRRISVKVSNNEVEDYFKTFDDSKKKTRETKTANEDVPQRRNLRKKATETPEPEPEPPASKRSKRLESNRSPNLRSKKEKVKGDTLRTRSTLQNKTKDMDAEPYIVSNEFDLIAFVLALSLILILFSIYQFTLMFVLFCSSIDVIFCCSAEAKTSC